MTEAGTVSAALVSVSVTLAPPEGAAPESVTVHVLEAFCPRVLGLQPSEETVTAAGAINVIELVLDTVPRVAVMTAVWLDDTALAVAVKVAVVAPAATVTEAGTASDGLLSDRLTVMPPLGAACDNVTVQLTFPGGVNEVGVHVRLLSVAADHPW